MSAIENRREVAYRVFAAEFDDAEFSYSEGDEERAPNYVVTPTGARVNRLFAVGALTEVESVNEEVLRGRIADPTGVFVTYAGQYQPEATNFLDRATPPMFVSITGKARTYEPEDSDRVFTSVRPESINEVDAGTRDRWVVAAARATLERVATMRAALAMDHRGEDLRAALEARGVDESLATGVPLAIDHYGPTEHYLEAVRTLAVQALELVAGEREAVDSLTVAPGETGPNELGPLPDVPAATPPEGGDVPVSAGEEPAAEATEGVASGDAGETVETADSDESADASDAEDPTVGTTEPAASSAAGTADGTETPEAEPAETTESAETAESESAETTAADSADSTPATEPEASETPDVSTASAESGAADESATETADETAAESGTEPAAESEAEPEAAAGGGLGDFDAGGSEADASEATDEPATDDAASAGGLGDFETDDASSDDASADADATEADAASPGEMYEMDDEERAEIEEEFGAEFSTGNEVDDPGEADIDVPDADDLEAEAAEARAETNGETPAGSPDPGDAAAAAASESDSGGAESDEEPATPPEDARPDTQSPDAAAADSPDGGVADDAETPEEAQTASGESDPASSAGEADESADSGEPAEDVDLEGAVVEVMADLDDGDGADREAVVSTIVDRYGADADEVEDAIQDALMSGKCYEPNEGTLKSI